MAVVTLTDEGLGYWAAENFFDSAGEWARDYCASFLQYEISDVSDFTTAYDTVAVYKFEDETDATMFSLRWKQ